MDGWGIDLAISNGGAEMHQWDTPTVRIGSLPLVVEGVKLLLRHPLHKVLHFILLLRALLTRMHPMALKALWRSSCDPD